MELSLRISPQLSSKLIYTDGHSLWHRSNVREDERVFFEPVGPNDILEECFEDYIHQEKPQLAPGGAFIIHRRNLIEWVENPNRFQVFGWVDVDCYPAKMLMIRQSLRQTSQITFLL